MHQVTLVRNLLTIHKIADRCNSVPSSVDQRYGHVETGRLRTRHSTILDIAALNVSEYNIRLRQILSVKNLNVGIGENRAYQQTGYCNEHHPGLETLQIGRASCRERV